MPRSSAFCERLQLAPSASPYLLVTSVYPGAGVLDRYPDSFPTELPSFSVVGMEGKRADEINSLLVSLADQLVLNNIGAFNPRQEQWWRGLERSYESVRSSMVGTAKGFTCKIKTPFFEVEKRS